MRAWAQIAAVLVAALFVAQAAPAQQSAQVLTIDQDRLFAETDFGDRVAASLAEEANALSTENRRIEAELTVEERELTELRPTLSLEEFQALANAFDEKVQQIRIEQDAKSRELQAKTEERRQQFFTQIVPILGQIVRERGALVIMNRRDVFLSADSIDITDEAISRINASLGDGGGR